MLLLYIKVSRTSAYPIPYPNYILLHAVILRLAVNFDVTKVLLRCFVDKMCMLSGATSKEETVDKAKSGKQAQENNH